MDDAQNAQTGAIGMLAGPMIALLVVGAVSALLDPAEIPRRPLPASPEIPAARYESLRDMVAADPELADPVIRAMRDGIIDEREADAIASGRVPVAMAASAARRDLLSTARNVAP